MVKFHEQFDYVLSEVLNVSGNSVAKSIGAHQGLVNRYRRGLTNPPIDFAQKFCEFYGISANWLLLNIEPIRTIDIGSSDLSNDRFRREIEKKNQLRDELLELKKAVENICEKHL